MSLISNIDTQDLVSSKENIQPLRRGRDTSKLCAALQAETNTDAQQELEKQRNEFEVKLRSNTSEDPLANWCDYIHWIEQSFPRRGEEGKLNVVLHKCLKKFKDCEQYMNDIRFVKLCIKYAELEDNTVELLSQIHRHGIGVKCAEIYIAWAEKYAANNCYKKAVAIYEKGLKCSAQPIELLENAYKGFQAFLVQKMLDDREMFQPTSWDSNPVEQRQPYNKLQSVAAGHKEVVPSLRTGSSVIGPAGKLHKMVQLENKPKSNTMITVFEDREDCALSSEPAAKLEKIPSKKTTTKENTVKAGPWNNKKNRNVPFKINGGTTLPFHVHRDEDGEKEALKTKVVPSSVLKSHKVKPGYEDEGFANAPLFYFEPYDPTKVPMYCKEQVYAGGIEFQFEELRAMVYRRRQEELKRCHAATPVVDTVLAVPEEVVEPPSTIESETHSKPKAVKMKLKTVKTCDKAKTTTESVEKPKLKSGDSSNKKDKTKSEARRKTILSNPLPVVVPEDHIPCTDSSMTIHTKEAFNEMQQLWFSKPPSPVPLVVKSTKAVAKSILKPSKPCFSLYVDESCLEYGKPAEQDKPLDLTFKLENHSREEDGEGESGGNKCNGKAVIEGAKKKTGLANRYISPRKNKENFFVHEDKEPGKTATALKVDDEDKENGIPDDYWGPIGKTNRKVSGILTPAENIEIAQLSDEEFEVEEDDTEVGEENDDVPVHDFSSIIRCNTTAITETLNFTKGFRFPRGESTPNMPKTFHNKEDCNESYLPDPAFDKVQGTARSDKPMEVMKQEDKREKKVGGEGETCNKNLSVIAETSREYRSSSSASSGATSTLAFRPSVTHSKNYPYTPSDVRNSKFNFTTSQTATFHKGKLQNYTSYEASSESSQTALKTPVTREDDTELMKKLNAIDSVSVNENTKREDSTREISREISKLEIDKKEEAYGQDKTFVQIDPFSNEVIEKLLQEIEFPQNVHTSGYFLLSHTELPPVKMGNSVTLGAQNYKVKKILGQGSYARIFGLSNTSTGEYLIAKYQKPAFPWEFYIAREIQSRIQDKDLMAMFMNVESGYFFKNCSILLTQPVEHGDLLAVIRKMQEGKMMCQMLAMHFTCQILKILETLHSCKIIHGDIKPDNFLLRSYNGKLQLQLIDFGRSIDMSLFPEETTFRRVVTTEGFTTVEMKTGKPWTYQIDYYGAAVCSHCLLFGDYMKIVERNGLWSISKIIPRYWAKAEWNNFFTSLINVESCSKLPDLAALRQSFEDVLAGDSEVELGLYNLNNVLNNR